MNLQEILAAKKQQSQIRVEKEEKEEEIPYLADAKYLSSSNISQSFFSVYSILIKNPYQDSLMFREFSRFILGDDIYVLNTFSSLNIDKIFSLYMEYNPPQTPFQLHQLWITLGDIHLCVPGMYQSMIEEIIRKNWD